MAKSEYAAVLALRLSPEDKEFVRREAFLRNTTKSGVVREWIQEKKRRAALAGRPNEGSVGYPQEES